MTKKAVKFFSSVLIIVAIFTYTTVCISANSTSGTDYSEIAQAVYLYNCNSKRVLYSMGEDKILPVGPTAKIMTGLIACELFEKELDKTVTVSSDMLENISGNVMGLKSGMTVTLKDLLYGTVCGGNNDAAQVLAIASYGSVSAFTEKMNAYALKLYMQSTGYSNPTGLDDTPSKTTLLDTVKLAAAASRNALYMEISSAANYKTSVGTTIYNRNALISQFSAQGYINKNAKGIIAGSTESGGFSLVTSIENDDLNYICIVMGADSDATEIYSYSIANELVDTHISKYAMRKIIKANQNLASLNVELAATNENSTSVLCIVPDDVYAFLPSDYDSKKLKYKPYLHCDELTAPIEKGICVGGVDVYYEDELIASSPLITNESVDSNYILSFLTNMKEFLAGRFFIIFVIIFIPSLSVYLYLRAINTRHKKVSTIRYKRFY